MFKKSYKDFIQDYFSIVDKNNKLVSFRLNKIQDKFLLQDSDGHKDVILKARQQGFSSLILAMFTKDFLLRDFSWSVIVADDRGNAEALLDRVRLYIESYENKKGIKIPLRYNSKNELYNEITRSRYTIGTAQNVQFGRSKTITNLHFSEAAFYPDMESLLTGAMQAVIPDGSVIIETTANGFNYFKDFWMDCITGKRNFKPSFYGASEFYSKEFLKEKKAELGRMYPQEYPETYMDAFLASGDTYFDKDVLTEYLQEVKKPIKVFKYGYYDLDY